MDNESKKIEKRILHLAGKAVADYEMIKENDHIAIGLSGGKDSMLLLCVLAALQKKAPLKFTLHAVHLTMGLDSRKQESTIIQDFCEKMGIPCLVEETSIWDIVFTVRREKNPCSLCANLRNGALHNAAIKLGCNAIALGHHADDAIESLLMSMFYEGRIRSFSPYTWLSRKELKMIRPLAYVDEGIIKQAAASMQLPVIDTTCPASGNTKRAEIKKLLNELSQQNPDIRSRLLRSLSNVQTDHLWLSNK